MYLARLMGYDYDIQYRSGVTHQAADARSRLSESQTTMHMILFVPCLTFLTELRQQLAVNKEYRQRRSAILESPAAHPGFSVVHDLILHKGRIWLYHELPIIPTLIHEYHHATPTGRHTGVTKTLARILENFHWQGIRDDVTRFVAQCLECQLTKYETKKSAGLLCPLPVPHRPWEDLSLDFIMSLPPYKGHTVILVVVGRFSKGIHPGMLPATHTVHMVASLFLNIIVKLHGIARSLVSDRDPLFVNHFWHKLFRLSGILLRMSSTYHPQTDGQTEVLNRVIEQYLRAFVYRRPGSWGKLLPWVEWSHNSSWTVGTGSTPYEITFGRKPFSFPKYIVGSSNIDFVDELLTDRDVTFQAIRKKLVKAQEYMKTLADTKHREVVYHVGDWVLLKLRPYRQSTVKSHPGTPAKLVKHYYGPFKILERIGEVAYRLQLPDGARIHPIFHCSVLKPFKGSRSKLMSLRYHLQRSMVNLWFLL